MEADAQGYTTGNWYVLDDAAHNLIVAGSIQTDLFALDATSLQLKHTTIVSFESV